MVFRLPLVNAKFESSLISQAESFTQLWIKRRFAHVAVPHRLRGTYLRIFLPNYHDFKCVVRSALCRSALTLLSYALYVITLVMITRATLEASFVFLVYCFWLKWFHLSGTKLEMAQLGSECPSLLPVSNQSAVSVKASFTTHVCVVSKGAAWMQWIGVGKIKF